MLTDARLKFVFDIKIRLGTQSTDGVLNGDYSDENDNFCPLLIISYTRAIPEASSDFSIGVMHLNPAHDKLKLDGVYQLTVAPMSHDEYL